MTEKHSGRSDRIDAIIADLAAEENVEPAPDATVTPHDPEAALSVHDPDTPPSPSTNTESEDPPSGDTAAAQAASTPETDAVIPSEQKPPAEIMWRDTGYYPETQTEPESSAPAGADTTPPEQPEPASSEAEPDSPKLPDEIISTNTGDRYKVDVADDGSGKATVTNTRTGHKQTVPVSELSPDKLTAAGTPWSELPPPKSKSKTAKTTASHGPEPDAEPSPDSSGTDSTSTAEHNTSSPEPELYESGRIAKFFNALTIRPGMKVAEFLGKHKKGVFAVGLLTVGNTILARSGVHDFDIPAEDIAGNLGEENSRNGDSSGWMSSLNDKIEDLVEEYEEAVREEQPGGGEGNGEDESTPPETEPQEETVELGKYTGETNSDTGMLEGTYYDRVAEFANELNLDLTEKELHDAVDQALIDNHIGGEDASYDERWEAAKKLGPEYEISLSSDIFGETPETTKQPEEVESEPLNEYDDKLNSDTGYLNGTAYDSIAQTAEGQAKSIGVAEFKFTTLQQQEGFNAAYHDLVDRVLEHNDLTWDSAKNLQPGDTLDIPKKDLQEFVERYASSQAQEQTQIPRTETEEGLYQYTSNETITPSEAVEVGINDSDQDILRKIINKDTTEFTQYLLDRPAELHQLYPHMNIPDLQHYADTHNSLPPIPKIESNGVVTVDPEFVANLNRLYRSFQNEDEDLTLAA